MRTLPRRLLERNLPRVRELIQVSLRQALLHTSRGQRVAHVRRVQRAIHRVHVLENDLHAVDRQPREIRISLEPFLARRRFSCAALALVDAKKYVAPIDRVSAREGRRARVCGATTRIAGTATRVPKLRSFSLQTTRASAASRSTEVERDPHATPRATPRATSSAAIEIGKFLIRPTRRRRTSDAGASGVFGAR